MMKRIPIMLAMIVLEIALAYLFLNMVVFKDNVPLAEQQQEKTNSGAPELASVPFGEVVVNPRGSKGRRFFVCDFLLMYPASNTEFPLQIEAQKPVLQDTVMSIMMDMQVDYLVSPEGKEELRKKLKSALEYMLDTEIEKVLYSRYLIQ